MVRANINDCIQEVFEEFCAEYFKKGYNEKVLACHRLCTTMVMVAVCFGWAGERCRDYS